MSISKEIINVLDAIGKKFGIAVDWTAENIIPYLTELSSRFIRYEIVTSIIWFLIGLTLFIVSFFLFKQMKNNISKSHDEKKYSYDEREHFDDIAGVFVIFAVICFVVGLSMLLSQVFNIVTCLTLPEKILISEISDIYSSIH